MNTRYTQRSAQPLNSGRAPISLVVLNELFNATGLSGLLNTIVLSGLVNRIALNGLLNKHERYG